MEQVLIKLGLTDKEAKVYTSLLELAEDTVQNISKKSGVNRATTYVILDKLMQYGLTSQVKKGKKTYFVAEDPHELENIMDAQQQEVEHRRRFLGDTMNQLVAVYNRKKGKPTVRYFEGIDGLEALDRYREDEIAKSKHPILAFAPIDLMEDRFPKRRSESLQKRVKAGVWAHTIYTHKDGPIDDKKNKQELRKAIFIPKNKLPLDMTIQILDWGVRFFNLEQSNPYAVLIEDEGVARNMRLLYELAWKGANNK